MKKIISQPISSFSPAVAEALKTSLTYLDVNFRMTLENSLSPFVLSSPQGNILHANKAACKLFGHTLSQMKKFRWEDILSIENNKFLKELELWNAGGSYRGELTGIKKNDESFHFEYCTTIYTDNKQQTFSLTQLQDLSEIKKLNAEISLLINNTEEGFLLIDKQLIIISFNTKSDKLFKKILKKHLLKGTSILDYAEPERRDALKEMYARVFAGGSEKSKLSFSDKNGENFTFKIKYHPARNDQDIIIGVFISLKNISKEQAHLSSLQQTQDTLRKIMNSSLDIICTLNRDGAYVQVSSAVESMWGFQPEEVVGKLYTDFVFSDDIEATNNTRLAVMSGVNITNFENRIRSKNGSIVYIGWSAHWDEADELLYCVARNITMQKLSEQKLALSEQRFRSLVQDGSDLVAIMDEEGNYKYVSPSSFVVLGYESSDLVGKNAFDFIHPDDLENLKIEFAKLGSIKKLQLPVFRFRHQNGDWRWIETSIANLINEVAVKGYVANSRDITERVIGETEKNFSAMLLDTIGQAAIATDLDGIISYWNKAAEIIYGHSRQEAIGANIMNFMPAPESIDTPEWDLQKIDLRKSWAGEFLVKRKNGEVFPAFITNSPVYDQQHKLCGSIGISSDISERKKAEKNLEIANERHHLILKATNDVVWDWDIVTDKVIRSKDNMMKLFGYDVNDDINHSLFWSSNVHPDEQARVQLKFKEFFNDPTQQNIDCEYRFKMADGSYAYVYDKAYALRNKEGEVIRMIGSVKDISYVKREEIKLKQINQELVQQAKELAFSNRELEQFAYITSHDLQEPLRMVSSFLTQIENKYEPLLDEKGKRYIHFAVDGAKRMRRIILDLLEYSRAGNKEDLLEDVNLEIVLKEIKALLRRNIEEKNAIITSSALPVVKAHMATMRQVFQNLVTNALVYSREGVAPNIHISAVDKTDYWQFEITDNGIGIFSEYFEKIFVIFQRLHDKETYPGNGIGLSITKKIIENYGGNIWVKSNLGEFSTFYFTIYKQRI